MSLLKISAVICSMRLLITLLISLFTYSLLPAQQDAMLQGKRKQRKVWRRWSPRERKNKTAYNPYLKKKKGNRVSDKMAEGNKKEIRKQRRDYKKQMKQGKKRTQD